MAGPRMDGLVALISGGARGQGAAEARRFVEEGASVVVGDILDDEGKALADELGDACTFVHLDVTDFDQWTAAVEETERIYGKLDVLVNNAGILKFGGIRDTSIEDFELIHRVNTLGTFLGMKAAVPAMRKAGGGSIVNISSIEGIRGMKGVLPYTASKFAVTGMTKSVALEVAKYGIRVNSVHPGAVDTPMTQPLGDMTEINKRYVPAGRACTSEEVADLVVYLASPESRYCTGSEFVIDGGATAGSTFSAM
ncbi:MAG TPA: glucose 1-dehydrogenase [Acidimicrobiia bacterium]|nr:glucose 1-dehydrogenase [Acidimicrobiia bacterium]